MADDRAVDSSAPTDTWEPMTSTSELTQFASAPPDSLARRQSLALARERLFGTPAELRIARYRLERRLGIGGMGEVFLAVDEELERKVAIKQLVGYADEDRDRARLREEARALARLSHPNVVQVYEVGEHEGHTYLAMEYVEGETLAAWLAAQPRGWTDVLGSFCAAGRGLAAAHEAGIIHRDFKPENVLLGRDGSVRVADFGVALTQVRSCAGADEPEPEPLRGSSIAGTIRYMAPEQLRGGPIDAKSDQFGFCVALYEALWRTQPYAGKTVLDRLTAIEREDPRAPELAGVPAGLWRIVRRGLARDPAQRWPDMHGLLAALERFPRRRRRLLASAAAIPLLGLLAAGLAVAQERERAGQEALCEGEAGQITADWNPQVEAELAAVFAAGGRSSVTSSWTRTAALLGDYAGEWTRLRGQTCREARVEGDRSEASREQVAACLDDARVTFATLIETLRSADAELLSVASAAANGLPVLSMCTSESWLAQAMPAEAGIEAEVAQARAGLARIRALKLAGQHQRGVVEAQELLAVAERLGWTPLIVEARLALGELLERVADYEQARAQLHRGFVDATAVGHDFVALRAAIALTRVEGVRLERPAQGRDWGALAQALLDRLGLRGTMHEASSLDAIAGVERRDGQPERALASYRRVIELDAAVHGPEHPDVAISLLASGRALLQLDRVDEAEAAYRRANQIQLATLGPEHPDLAASIAGLGMVAQARGEFDEALAAYREALRIEEAAFGPEHPYVAGTRELIAELQRERAG